LTKREAERFELFYAFKTNKDISGIAAMKAFSAVRCLDKAKFFIIPDCSSCNAEE